MYQPLHIQSQSVSISNQIPNWQSPFGKLNSLLQNSNNKKNLLTELSNLKSSPNCANTSRANAKINIDCAESKLQISEKVISDLFEENKEVKRQLTEVTSKTESLQSELLEANKTNFFLEQKLESKILLWDLKRIMITRLQLFPFFRRHSVQGTSAELKFWPQSFKFHWKFINGNLKA